MLNAIQTGIFTPSTKQRLDELEKTKSQLEVSILQEEMHKLILTFNYKDGSKTITLAEVEGSDLSVLGAPAKPCDYYNHRVFSYHFAGIKTEWEIRKHRKQSKNLKI